MVNQPLEPIRGVMPRVGGGGIVAMPRPTTTSVGDGAEGLMCQENLPLGWVWIFDAIIGTLRLLGFDKRRESRTTYDKRKAET